MIRRDARPNAAIAIEYGVSQATIGNIKAGRTHKVRRIQKPLTEDTLPKSERVLLDKILLLEAEVARLQEELASCRRTDVENGKESL